MSREVVTEPRAPSTVDPSAARIQRTCSCGAHTNGGECEGCRRKRERLERPGVHEGAPSVGSSAPTSRGAGTRASARTFSRVPARTHLEGTPRVQARLEVGRPDDRFEREAERTAEAVMRGAGGPLHMTEVAAPTIAPCGSCDHEPSPSAQASLRSLEGRGRPLAGPTRTFFEARMGHGFGDIRLHTDAGANRLAESLGSRAFTWGRHIVFGAGEHSEQTWEGRRLLAHELTHTIQQGAAEAGSTAASATSERGSGQAGVARTAGPRVQRLCTDLATPPVLTCQIGPASPANTGTFVEFGVNSTALTPAAQARVQGIAAVWHATGGTAVLTLHGYASEEGRETHNCPLSCTRAEAVAAELRTPSNGDPGVAAASIVTVAHGETTEFSTDLAPNRRVVITTTGGGAAPTEVITSETVVTSPGARTRTTIGVGEEVNLTHVPGSASWTTTAGTLSAATGSTVLLTAPDTAQTVTVTAGAASLAFTVLAPDSVAMDRQPGTGVKHTLNRADSGILARVFLGPDTVNFSRIRYRELDVPGIPLPGAYSCNTFSTGHCSGAAAGACPDKALTDTVTAGMGTLSVLGDCAYSGHCGGTPPFTPGAIIVLIPYEYRLGAGPFRSITTVAQVHTLAADASTLTTTKAGATGTTTVAAPTVTIAQCP